MTQSPFIRTPYVALLADRGIDRALAENAGLRAGLNVSNGQIMHPAVAASLGRT